MADLDPPHRGHRTRIGQRRALGRMLHHLRTGLRRAKPCRRVGEERLDERGEKTRTAPRWVVERNFGWPNHCRAILVRWVKTSSNYLGLIKLASILLWCRRIERLPGK